MALYIKPPKGNISFNTLCEYVKKRIIFLSFLRGKSIEEITNGIQLEKFASCSECLIEGSMKDRISHFVLRLLCSVDSDMWSFFIQSETNLFIYRLEFYELSDIRRILKDAAKKCFEVCTHSFVIKPYKRTLTSLIMIAEDLNYGWKKKHIKVPFTAVLKFVENRTFPLNSGFVEVPHNSLKCLLAVVFEEILLQGLNQIRVSNCVQELKNPQMQYIRQEIKRLFKTNVTTSIRISDSILVEENLDQESENFPLCMANLHKLLRNNHRLQHTSRVQYILYLKEIGVPCQEVIRLFRKEYSVPVINKQVCNSRTCDHSWADSQNRYIYSIEHLYGNRGSRKNYKAHCCNALQNTGNSSDGGCPYACFDEKNLKEVLSSCSFKVKDIEDIILLSSSKKYPEACFSNLLMKIKNASEMNPRKEIRNINLNKINFQKSSLEENSKSSFATSALYSNTQISFNNFHCQVSKPSEFYFLMKNFKPAIKSFS